MEHSRDAAQMRSHPLRGRERGKNETSEEGKKSARGDELNNEVEAMVVAVDFSS